MNNKHLACIVVLLACVLVVQGVLTMHKRATAMRTAAELARQEADIAAATRRTQLQVLEDLQAKTSDLVAYLDAWEPHLSRIATPEAGEVNVNALLKQADLLLLSQRFEVVPNAAGGGVPNSANATVPQLVRAHLTIEDDFARTINWFGELESKLPTSRVSSLEIIRGQAGNDVRLNLVVDIPLARAEAAPTATP